MSLPARKILRIGRRARLWRPASCRLLGAALLRGRQSTPGQRHDEVHLQAAIDWLERAQDASGDGGVAGRYRLASGWSSAYPETTGYLVPTLLRLATEYGDPRFRQRAAACVEFLLGIQLASGAFPGLEIADNRSQASVFNTAQILCGLRAWYRENGESRVLESARRAADWLVAQQDPDGAWRRFLYGEESYTYMAHAACWLAQFGDDLGEAAYLQAGRRHLYWVMGFHDPQTGWFDRCDFSPAGHRQRRAVTHTLAYTLWGVLMLSRLLEYPEGIAAVRQAARGIAGRLAASGWLPGELNHRWEGCADYACLTGNAQLALVWFALHRLEAEPALWEAGLRALALVQAAQPLVSADPGIRGGIPGSDPPWGDYLHLALPNWAAKFFIDALLEKRAILAAG